MTDFHKNNDPFRGRESKEYTSPIPSREFILRFLEERGKPAYFKQMAEAFSLETEDELEGLRRRLIAMSRDGQIINNRRGGYGLVTQMELIRGRVQANKEGFGFLIPDMGGEDIFLPSREMQRVFSDDIVLVRVLPHRGRRREGVIVEILERNTHQVVGRYFEEEGVGYVDPNRKAIWQDILIPPGQAMNARQGQFVVVDIVSQPAPHRLPVGHVVEILGDRLTSGMEMELAIRAHELPFRWPETLSSEISQMNFQWTEDEIKRREDWRQLPFVTIDGEDAKDFDDAVYAEVCKGGYHLYVAIADVGYYVQKGAELDREAELRGNSVYFPARVIPMLPEVLSNEWCSLRPNVDRLVIGCTMFIDGAGKVQEFAFCEAVIHSHARLTYTQVAEHLSGKNKALSHLDEILQPLYQVYKKLLKQRHVRGAIDFDTVETKILFDQNGKIDRIVPSERTEAHRLIEEAMLAANVCAGEWLHASQIPVLYRIHDAPQASKIEALRDFLKPFGLRLSGGEKPQPKDFANFLERARKRQDAHLLQTVMLRSLQQAVYQPENLGHFGLSYDSYCHFTSPIRRYPDLLVHRAIRHLLQGLPPETFAYSTKDIARLGEHCSMTERRADAATRDAMDWLKCDYMRNKVGQVFEGRIVEVTSFGVFVELDRIYVQGLLHITALRNDYYHYDATQHILRGKRSGMCYRLGDSVEVLVARVDLDSRTIDFDLVGNEF